MTKDEIVATKYWHIDNGGFTVTVDTYGSMEIEFGFHGYSSTTVFLTANKEFNIKSLSEFLAQAAYKLQDLNQNN